MSCFRVSQLLNLIYGNISLKRNIRLAELDLPDALLDRFAGPKLGIAGIREQMGIYGRPLLATALKPRGSSPDELAALRVFLPGRSRTRPPGSAVNWSVFQDQSIGANATLNLNVGRGLPTSPRRG